MLSIVPQWKPCKCGCCARPRGAIQNRPIADCRRCARPRRNADWGASIALTPALSPRRGGAARSQLRQPRRTMWIKANPTKVQRNPTKSNQIKPNQTKSNQNKPNQTKSNQIKPNQTKSNQIKPNQTKSNQIKPNQTKSNQIKPNQTKSNQIKPN